MNPSADSSACPRRHLAVEHALLGLTGPQLEAFESHWASCSDCQASHAHALRESMEAADPEPVEPSLWAQIEARIQAEAGPSQPLVQPWKRWTEQVAEHAGSPGLTVRRNQPAQWQPTAIAGIEVQALSVSEGQRQATMLVRMAPGTAYPAHRHAGAEECYVLSGDLQVGDSLRLGPGDFQRAEAGSCHAPQSTRDGCLLLIQTSLDDELLA